jgi:hypothetical protein
MAGPRRGALDGPPADAVAADPLFAPAVPADRIGQDRVVWRDALFERFAGLLTYGSPLDKFAAIWAPVAALSRAAGVFPHGARWLNVWDPTDPVGANLDAYEPDLVYKNAPALPNLPGREKLRPRNIAVAANPVLLLSHVCYLQRLSGHPQPLACCVGDWLLDPTDSMKRLRPLGARAVAVRTVLRLVEVAILVLLLLVLWVVLFRSLIGPMLRPFFGVAASACLNVPPTWSDCGSQVAADVKIWAWASLVLALVVGVVGRYTTTLDAADQRVIDSPFGGRIRTLTGLALSRAWAAAKARRLKRPNP